MLIHLNRWQVALVLFLSGALMALGFAPYHFWPVIFVSLPVLYQLLTVSTSLKQALWRAWAFGYGYSMAGTWWIGNALLIDAEKFAWMLPFSVLGLSAVMALWFMLLGALVYYARNNISTFLFAALWMLVEYLRSLGMFGFPWNLTGYMALASLSLAQIASIVGVYGLSLLVVWLGLAPIALRQKVWQMGALPVLLVVALIIFGQVRLQSTPPATNIPLRLVQPNIAQEIKSSSEGRQQAIVALYELSVAKPVSAMPPIRAVIWPETSYPFTVHAGKQLPMPKDVKLVITGAIRAGEGAPRARQIWNSLVAINDKGQLLTSYDKHQLVPFGEFVPLRSVLPLDKITPGSTDFSRGDGPKTMEIHDVPPFSPLICYEVIFPQMATDPNHRPEWMLNVTNDGWYGDSPGPYQHLEAAQMRAIEQGLPVVRAANSGISAVIDSRGKIIAELKLNKGGFVDFYLPAAEKFSYYAKLGEKNGQLIVLFLIIFLLFYNVKSSKNK